MTLSSRGEAMLATYEVEVAPGDDLDGLVRRMTSHFYPGTSGRIPGDTAEARKLHGAELLAVEELPSAARFRVQISIPALNMGGSLAMLLSNVAGEVLSYGRIRLADLQLPAGLLAGFRGPRFGVPGIRDLLAIRGRPLLLAITKPCVGFAPEEGARIFFEAAVGGADIVKDDELLSDPAYCRRARRVKLYAEAARRAFEATGEHTLYAVNITDRPDRLLANAREAISLGAGALMLSFLQVGHDAARSVCEDDAVTVPVLGHNAGAAALTASSSTGIAPHWVSGLLPRLCGLDLAIFLTQHGKFPSTREQCRATVTEMRGPLGGLRPLLPIPAGGVTPDLVGALCDDYGVDVAIGAGGLLFGHPEGPRAGAAAFRAAIDACMEGRAAHGA